MAQPILNQTGPTSPAFNLQRGISELKSRARALEDLQQSVLEIGDCSLETAVNSSSAVIPQSSDGPLCRKQQNESTCLAAVLLLGRQSAANSISDENCRKLRKFCPFYGQDVPGL